jgi:transposase InsO family protein
MRAALSRLFNWRDALVAVQADTLIRWHRKGFRLFWRWKSKPTGRPRLPQNLQELIRTRSAENPSWGPERITKELMLKLGIQVSPRTVLKYLNTPGSNRQPDPKQRWLTFVRNHAHAMVASDFLVVVTAQFRILYVFVGIELGTRRILHYNGTEHPTAEWTWQQFRAALSGDHSYRFLLHDQDSIFSRALDQSVTALGVRVWRTPVRASKANSLCERFGGTLRRECLDFFIPLHARHRKLILKPWVAHFNPGRPHRSLGPAMPAPWHSPPPKSTQRHRVPDGHVIRSTTILGGLHHEYSLEKAA